MADQQQQIIYVEGKGFIPIQSGQTVEQAIASAPRGGTLSVENPMNRQQSVGVSLPPLDPTSAEHIINAIPQAAGMAAQLTPAGRTMTGAVGIPALIEAAIEMVRDGTINPLDVAGQGVLGGVGKGAGNAVEGLGKMGFEKVLKALDLPGVGLDSMTGIKVLPEAAIREGAKMTEAGVNAAKARAAQTGSGLLDELAQALESAYLKAKTAPSRMTFWPQEALANFFRTGPRQLKMGQQLAKARGMGPSAEAITRALETYQQGTTENVRGPRRREQ